MRHNKVYKYIYTMKTKQSEILKVTWNSNLVYTALYVIEGSFFNALKAD